MVKDDPKEDANQTAATLLGINNAIGSDELLQQLTLATKRFDHHHTDRHDQDVVSAGMVLTQALRSCSPLYVAKSKQVRRICRLLSMIYRCSDAKAVESFHGIGADLLPMLFEIIEINYRLGPKGDVRCLVKAQQVIARLSALDTSLIMVESKGNLLSGLLNVINGVTGKLAMFNATQSLARMSRKGENKYEMVQFPGLIDSLINVGGKHMDQNTRREAAAALMNLAWDARSKPLLTRHPNGIDAFIKLVGDTDAATRMSALRALNYLSAAAENKTLLVQHREGSVLEMLLRIANNTVEAKESLEATKALGNLACRVTASKMGNHPGLLSSLAAIASTCHDDKIVSTAAMAVKKLATYIRAGHSCHSELLRAVVKMASGTNVEAMKQAAKSLVLQTAFADNRVNMIKFKGGLLDAMTALATSGHPAVKRFAVEALGELTVDVCRARNVTSDKVLGILVGKLQKSAPMPPNVRAVRSYSYENSLSTGLLAKQ